MRIQIQNDQNLETLEIHLDAAAAQTCPLASVGNLASPGHHPEVLDHHGHPNHEAEVPA
jgi:hypothetical protein